MAITCIFFFSIDAIFLSEKGIPQGRSLSPILIVSLPISLVFPSWRIPLLLGTYYVQNFLIPIQPGSAETKSTLLARCQLEVYYLVRWFRYLGPNWSTHWIDYRIGWDCSYMIQVTCSLYFFSGFFHKSFMQVYHSFFTKHCSLTLRQKGTSMLVETKVPNQLCFQEKYKGKLALCSTVTSFTFLEANCIQVNLLLDRLYDIAELISCLRLCVYSPSTLDYQDEVLITYLALYQETN